MKSTKNKSQFVSNAIIVTVLKVLLHEFERRSKTTLHTDRLSEHSTPTDQRQLGLWDDHEKQEGAK
jgi:hypothetical protein